MARDISELGADVFDDSPKKYKRISPKKRNYIIGLSISGVLLVGVTVATVVLCNTALSDYSNVENVMYYFTPKNLVAEGEEPTAVLSRLPSDKTFPSTFRIPTQVLGYKVVGVAPEAFSMHEEIKKVIMPNTIEWIGEKAFYDCKNLSSFTWSKNLKDIGVDAFTGTKFYENLLKDDKGLYDIPSGILVYVGTNYFDDNTAIISDSLTEAQIANIKTTYAVQNVKKFSELNVKGICSGAFRNNQKITYIDLPETLDEISAYVFEGCTKLKAIDGSHTELNSIGKRAFANCEDLAVVNLPNALVTLGDEAFANTAVTEIPELDKIQSIGKGVFAGCTRLTSVNYSLNEVYENMFNGCSSLTSISWGDDNSNIDNVTYIGAGAFAGTAFTEFVYPKNVYTIEDFAFENCTSLQTLSLYGNFQDELLPKEEEEEDEEEDTRSLDEGEEGEEEPQIDYPCVNHSGEDCFELKGVQVIKEKAFNGCSSLSTINLYDDNYEINLDPEISGYENTFTFPYSVMRCDGSSAQNSRHYTFAGTNPSKILFSPNMMHIGTYAFNNVTSLTEVKVEQFEKSKMTTIKASAYQGCSNLESIELPHSILSIENSAFSGCKKLDGVEINQLPIKAINGGAFYDCQNLESLTLPETVTSIKTEAFCRTYKLRHLIIPSTVTEILSRSFTECRETAGEKMGIFIQRTYAAAHNGRYKINFGNGWHDNTAFDSYLLSEGENKLPGVSYWNGNEASPVAIELTSLEQSGTLEKTEFKKTDSFNSTGLTFKASYDDGTFIEFTRTTTDNVEHISWNKLNPGDTSVTGTYTVGAVTLSITVTGITVTD